MDRAGEGGVAMGSIPTLDWVYGLLIGAVTVLALGQATYKWRH